MPSKFPTGAAKFAIVGEKPGYQEAVAKIPYVGPSGRLLKEVLVKYGIDYNECFVSNAVACAPKDNANPGKDAVAACRPRLMAELRQAGASRVLATGAVAANSILQTKSTISSARVGPPKILVDGMRFEIVPTYHPAAALRAADNFKFILTDVPKLIYPAKQWVPPKFKVADTERRALAYLRFLEYILPNGASLAVDIETDTEKDVAFEHPDDTEILCVGVAYDRGHVVVFPGDMLRIPIVGKMFGLLLARLRLIAQNGKFDIPVLSQFHPDIKLSADSMLEHYVIDERRKIHGLEVMAMEYLGTPAWKWKTKQYTKNGQLPFSAVPKDVLYDYNAWDNSTTYELDELYTPQLEALGPKQVNLHNFLLRASTALMPVERDGVSIDLAYLQQLEESYPAKLATLAERLQQWVKNPRSHVQVKSALNGLGLECPSTAMPVLQELQYRLAAVESGDSKVEEIDRLINGIIAFRKADKVYGTYVKGTRKRLHKGKIHTSYLLHSTTTGRLSSVNPNLQNQPRGPEIRNLYIPSHPDHVFVKADFAQGEWRVVTILADEPYFAERFAAGRDVVADLQEELFRNRTSKQYRTLTKNVAYGSWYGLVLGRGKQGLYYAKHVLKMDPDEAYRYQRRLFELAANIPQWQERTRAQVLANETLETYNGRRRHFWLITPSNKHEVLNECLAYEPQSTLSDICLTGLIRLVEAGFAVRLTTHDEIVTECHWRDAERTKHAMETIMSEAATEFSTELPFPVEVKIGKSWGACA